MILLFCACLQLHIVFFRETYKSYKKAVHRFQDGLAVIAINLEVTMLYVSGNEHKPMEIYLLI